MQFYNLNVWIGIHTDYQDNLRMFSTTFDASKLMKKATNNKNLKKK